MDNSDPPFDWDAVLRDDALKSYEKPKRNPFNSSPRYGINASFSLYQPPAYSSIGLFSSKFRFQAIVAPASVSVALACR